MNEDGSVDALDYNLILRFVKGEISDFSDKEYFIHLLNYLKNKQKSGVDYSDVINAVEDRI